MTSGSPAKDRSSSSLTGRPGAPWGHGRVANMVCTAALAYRGQPLGRGGVLRGEVGQREDRLAYLDEQLHREARVLGGVHRTAADRQPAALQGHAHGRLADGWAVRAVSQRVDEQEGDIVAVGGVFAAPSDQRDGAQLGLCERAGGGLG